jgi:hypothetical protein
VHGIFAQAGATNVLWVWSPNFDDGGAYPIEPYFPGDAYLDWVGLDGFNWVNIYGASRSFNALFDRSYATVTSLSSKPVMIAETASNEAGDGGAIKAAWITDTYTNAIPGKPRIQAVVWFNVISHTTDGTAYWPIESSAQAQQAYAKAVAAPFYLGAWDAPTLTPTPTPTPAATPTAAPSPTPTPGTVLPPPALCLGQLLRPCAPTPAAVPPAAPTPAPTPTAAPILTPTPGTAPARCPAPLPLPCPGPTSTGP